MKERASSLRGCQVTVLLQASRDLEWVFWGGSFVPPMIQEPVFMMWGLSLCL